MNPIIFALRHPYTIMVGMLALVLSSGLALARMRIDIFPSLNLPVIYVAQPYTGLDPAQMEGLITNYYEYHFLYVAGIHHVESKNVQGVAQMKLFFHPDTNMAQAMAETVQYVNRARAFMPPGTVGPFVMRFDTGSVPVGYLVLSSKSKTIGQIQDQALFKVRPMFASLPGVSAPPPFGGNQRTIVLQLDPDKMRSYNASPDEVAAALNLGQAISPSGNIRIQDQMPIVPANTLVKDPKELGAIPLRLGENIYLRDLATIEDGTDIPTGYALKDGRRAVYICVTKRADASTLSVVRAVRANLDKMKAVLPEDIDVEFLFDQSPYVTRAMWGVGGEGLLCAFLTGLMVLLFLHDLRSVIVVVLNIPLSLLGSVVGLWLTGQSLNLMTLSGLALSIGILVDEATVEVENIHTHFEHTPNIARAVRLGNAQTAVPRLLAMLCVLAVFLPAFFMEGAAREMFVPLSLAVGFSMITSYILSSTFVPVASVWLLRHYHPETVAGASGPARFSLARLQARYERLLNAIVPLRWPLVAGYFAVVAAMICLVGGRLGTEIFPSVDAGQFQLRLRAADGTRIELTEEIARQALEIIKDEAGPERVELSLGYVGLIPSSYPINTIFLWTGGPEEAVLRVALKRGGGVRVEELKHTLREKLPVKLRAWLADRLRSEGLTEQQVDGRLRGLKLSFEPADIVNEVMSFGAPTPVEVAVSGPKFADTRAYADRLRAALENIPALVDLQIVQALDYPALTVQIDRELAGQSGVTASDVGQSLVPATSSSRFTVPVFWADPNTGIGYQVQVEVPPYQTKSSGDLGLVPIKNKLQKKVLLQNVARIEPGKAVGQYDRYNMRRLVSMTANIEGSDLAGVAADINRAVQTVNAGLWSGATNADGKAGWKNAITGEFAEGSAQPMAPPRGLQIDVRGQIVPMRQIFGALGGGGFFEGMTIGLVMAIVAIFLLLTAYFQSVRLALASVATVPAVFAGASLMLAATGTRLNIQSLVGLIMASGVAAANAILLTSFAERIRREGKSAIEAGKEAAHRRLRPLLMTSFAMIAGMLPMALGWGDGGEQTAPLGRAVVGGLLASMTAKLLVLPSIFAVAMGKSSTASASLDPDDLASEYCDQAVDGGKQAAARQGQE